MFEFTETTWRLIACFLAVFALGLILASWYLGRRARGEREELEQQLAEYGAELERSREGQGV